MTEIVLPQATKQTMFNLTDRSIKEQVELCVPIFPDFSLGEIKKGSQIECDYPHAKGAIGLFHTHPIPEPASPRDFLSTISDDHELMCVGRPKHYLFDEERTIIGISKETIVSCFRFRKNEYYYSFQKKTRDLNSVAGDFERKIQKKYGYIPKRVTEFTDDEYGQYLSLQDTADDLDERFKLFRNSLIEKQVTMEL